MRSVLSRILWGATAALMLTVAPARAEAAGPFGQQPGLRTYSSPGYHFSPGHYYSPGYYGYGYHHYPAYPSVDARAGGYFGQGVGRAPAVASPRRSPDKHPGSGRVDPGMRISRPWLKNLPRGWGGY